MTGKGKQKRLGIEISNQCYQNCLHCCNNSRPNGHLMPFPKIERRAAEVKEYLDENESESVGVFLAGGEPTAYEFEDKRFSDVAALFKYSNLKRLHLSISTRGRWKENPKEFLRQIYFGWQEKPIGVCLSANLYQPDNSDSMTLTRQSLEDLFLLKVYDSLLIHITVDEENCLETMQRFINEVATPLEFKKPDRLNLENKDSKELYSEIAREDFKFERDDGIELEVAVGPFQPVGRGEKLGRRGQRTLNCYIVDNCYVDWYITQKGFVFPCCIAEMGSRQETFFGEEIDKFPVKKLFEAEDKVFEHLRKRLETLKEYIQRDIKENHPSLNFDRVWNICYFCSTSPPPK